ncbi:MAG: iron-sulfur cluster assembly accessory protein [uncultured bacterium]|nr:MAG: iron-sulfur cluster assembly accessory protein [uncultured bacterium]OFW68749.1 MAG: heme biosynthesis protein HemY [Alphaproteobacteria bacterium GWC2_42_16]OFW73255.1 MAG: heme biosynthesis protein HemY [Alphaproteobacteria bacterium GWA2_41_27]OFW81911.1 MAG: heme biosynthesis protein HemY [Alphaproteobacteria bacterium RIFCSPHIGHO2_12_FULL_42_100]OFW84903.1 MAG: heme biosynthesis protein HemY [Alphaproteobacteria bacterium RBG_16_42_14]OFW91022.1 MAG: heme biosynthesis protein HemY
MSLKLTESAAKKIVALIEMEPNPETAFFRVMVAGGGCAGFQYAFSMDHVIKEDDQVLEDKGVKIVIDEVSLPFIEDAEVDFVEELIGSSFQVKNPKASSSCGCGSSFSV